MSIELKVIAFLLAAIAAVGAVIGFGHARFDAGQSAGRAYVQAQWNAEKVVQLAAAQKAEADNRRIEQQRQTSINEVTQNAQIQIDQAQSDEAAAATAADGLRRQLAAFAARSRAAARHPAVAQPGAGEQNPDPIDLLADLFTRADAAAGELAGSADRLRIAGTAGEAAGDAFR